MDKRYKAAEIVVKECFWGDYEITPEELLKRFDSEDARFKQFIFSRIIDNSSHPSRYLRMLFTMEELQTLLKRVNVFPVSRIEKRLNLVSANILETDEEIPEYSWRT